MWKELQKGWIPPTTISFDEYEHVRNNPEQYPKHYVGLVGFAATYGSKWFGGYARAYKSDGVTPRDMPAEGIRNIMSQLPKLHDVHFISGDYIKKTPIHKLSNWLIYCDPPYRNTTGYRNSIDHDVFWDWCDKLSKNNIVVVSEYTAPEHWNEVLYKSQTTKLTPDKHSDRIERIFMR
jgi:DNA adenine methylase